MLKYVVSILVFLALSVVIGGIFFFGAGVAAVLFEPGLLPSRTIAGAANSAILERLGLFLVGACTVLVLGGGYLVVKYGQWLQWGVLLVSLAMLAAAVYAAYWLFPELDQLRSAIGSFEPVSVEKAALYERFQQGHDTYSLVMRMVLGGGVVVLMLHSAGLVRHAVRIERQLRPSAPISAPVVSAAPVDDAPSGSGDSAPPSV